ncbi:MAG: ribonuclease H-like YkuK family protein [Flavobacteriaceae bacterium]|nr:ribonuclease H-like YkuK family protein [Flavobacteriaceae bacterium]
MALEGQVHAFNFDQIRADIKNSSSSTAIYVGCDSQVFYKKGIPHVAYATAIVLHIDSRAGGRLHRNVVVEPHYGSLKQRLMREVGFAIEAALEIVDVIENRPFQIHLDINPDENHKSSICVKEAAGYVLGCLGIQPTLKPNAFVASSVSDRFAVKIANNYG